MSVSIEVRLNIFPQLAGQFDAMVEGALDAGVQTAIATADPLTPVDTGALRGNKTIERGQGSRTITWNQDYAAFNEMGTYKMAARPFAAPGADAALPVIESHLSRFGGR
ncbi:MAG: hypothetical protein M3451_13640 [Chloroflexota bacterium]|nr:hypothetical protein [Chloroflexota bacterium]